MKMLTAHEIQSVHGALTLDMNGINQIMYLVNAANVYFMPISGMVIGEALASMLVTSPVKAAVWWGSYAGYVLPVAGATIGWVVGELINSVSVNCKPKP